MRNLIDNPKAITIIENVCVVELEKVKGAINAAIDFYLCRDPFIPINATQAGNIYFLRKLLDSLRWESSRLYLTKNKGAVFCHIPDNDQGWVTALHDSLEATIDDVSDSFDYFEDPVLHNRTSLLRVLMVSLNKNLKDPRRYRHAS